MDTERLAERIADYLKVLGQLEKANLHCRTSLALSIDFSADQWVINHHE